MLRKMAGLQRARLMNIHYLHHVDFCVVLLYCFARTPSGTLRWAVCLCWISRCAALRCQHQFSTSIVITPRNRAGPPHRTAAAHRQPGLFPASSSPSVSVPVIPLIYPGGVRTPLPSQAGSPTQQDSVRGRQCAASTHTTRSSRSGRCVV